MAAKLVMDFLRLLSKSKRHERLRSRVNFRYQASESRQHDRLCIFAHHDRWNRVDPHVLHYIRNVREAGYDVHFISTSNSLKEEDVNELLEHCFEVWVRPNRGLDFGSFQAGLAQLEEGDGIKKILLINDSVYGPLRPLKPIIDQMETNNLDVWSMTDSLQREYHLQSYFLHLSREALDHHLMKRFWFSAPFSDIQKERVVKQCEIGFSRVCKKASFKMGARTDCQDVARLALKDFGRRIERLERHQNADAPSLLDPGNLSDFLAAESVKDFARNLLTVPCNPTHDLWNYLIADFDHPFIKVELVKKNPVLIGNLWILDSILPETYPMELIQNHLRRVG